MSKDEKVSLTYRLSNGEQIVSGSVKRSDAMRVVEFIGQTPYGTVTINNQDGSIEHVIAVRHIVALSFNAPTLSDKLQDVHAALDKEIKKSEKIKS